jgi:hypothetical protein
MTNAAPEETTAIPAAPVIGATERDVGTPYPLDSHPVTIGWHFRPKADGGAVYLILGRAPSGSLTVIASFPLTEAGWSETWQFLVLEHPTAVPQVLQTLREREAEARRDVERGLALLALQAQAADRRVLGWVKRRVEQLEILDTRAVRWRVSVDFEVPVEAPVIYAGAEEYRLVPVTTLPKGDLVAFDLRDERDEALWLPTSNENNRLLAPALVVRARRILGRNRLPGTLERDLMWIAASLPSAHRTEYQLFAAAAAAADVDSCRVRLTEVSEHLRDDPPWHVRKRWRAGREWDRAQRAHAVASAKEREAIKKLHKAGTESRKPDTDAWAAACLLMKDQRFRSLLEELAVNYLVLVAIPTASMTRRIIKLRSERRVTYWSGKSKWWKLLQGLGLRFWPLVVMIGGRGGSHHLEVAAPRGVDVVRIVARPRDPKDQSSRRGHVIRAAGITPHVHISVPATSPFRYRATIDLRASRGGWLFASVLVGALIAVVMMVGRHNIDDLFRASQGAVDPEAGTAASLLLALLSLIALWLTRPGEHPLAARLLLLVRVLILVDVTDVLVGTGDLVLHQVTRAPPATMWSVLAWTSVGIFAVLALSWLLPRPMRSHDTEWR